MKAKAEVGGGEDGEGFDKDVCDGFFAGEMRVELIPGRMLAKVTRKHVDAPREGPGGRTVSDRANKNRFRTVGDSCPCRSGNRKRDISYCIILFSAWFSFLHGRSDVHSQLEQRQVGVAIVGPILALLLHIILENACRLWVVAVQAVEDLVDVLGPLGRLVERNGSAHDERS